MDKFQSHRSVREPAFAGRFYADSKNELEEDLHELFREAEQNHPVISENLRAIISPHAGYIFSGAVAASAFNQIRRGARYKRVFILASSHRIHFKGAAIYKSGDYKTPLGKMKVDITLARQLIDTSELFLDKPEAHDDEHSLEVQLPFLQHQLDDDYLLVPIILGTNDPDDVKTIAGKLKPFFNRENLFVVSTDFSHYPSFNDAKIVDAATADTICLNQPQKLLEILEKNGEKRVANLATSLCGWTSVLTLLYLTENSDIEYRKVEYRNSGHASAFGDKHRVVGYWAITVTEKNKEQPFRISKEEQKNLLEIAKTAITKNLKTGKRDLLFSDFKGGMLNTSAGAFVSIYVQGNLRGCIGSFAHPDKSLNEVVQKSAISATRDYRFEPISEQELEDMKLEISVLSPMKKIESVKEIELGKHGIYIKKGGHNGTFLPQVADKTGWNLEQFLGHCARDKAGLSWEGWKDAEIYIYEAFIFSG